MNSDNEKEDKEEDEKGGNEGEADGDEDEDDWMVPHGYLSDEEGDGGEHLDKDVLKSLEEEFYKEHMRETKVRIQ